MGRPRSIDRGQVLEAAGAIIGELGFAALTLEAVAAKAGISKGGLQYLFKSKQQLMAAMIEHYSQKTAVAVAKAEEELPDTPSRPLKAYIVGSLLDGAVRRDATTAALLAAAIAEPECLAFGKEEYRKALDGFMSRGVSETLAMVVMCAVDGLMLTEFLEVDPYTPSQRKQLVTAMLELAETGQLKTD